MGTWIQAKSVIPIYEWIQNGNIKERYAMYYSFQPGDYIEVEGPTSDGSYNIIGCYTANNNNLNEVIKSMKRADFGSNDEWNLATKHILFGNGINLNAAAQKPFNLISILKNRKNPAETIKQTINESIGGSDKTVTVNETTYMSSSRQVYTFGNLVATEKQSSNDSGGFLSSFLGPAEPLDIRSLRGILGIPHQFSAIADPRLQDTETRSTQNITGRIYNQHIIKYLPLLVITPGLPKFAPEATNAERGSLIDQIINGGTDSLGSSGKSYSGKYYTLNQQYVQYFKYVTAMLRAAAMYLGIGDVTMDGTPLKNYNWALQPEGTANRGISTGSYSNIWRDLGFGRDCVALYADFGNTTSDTFSNSVTQSQLANTINSLSDSAREVNFLMGTIGSQTGYEVSGDFTKKILDMAPAANDGILSNVVQKAKALLSGGRLVFPEIWSDSSFGRSYTGNMKLVSPSGDKISIFLNILAPLFHVLAMALPRQSDAGGQTYVSPFLLRCYYKGSFNVDMGIMTGLSVTRGAEAEWTVDGIPTVAELQFEIKDLYEGMFMSPGNGLLESDSNPGDSLLTNITELDYIANSCGININKAEESRAWQLYKALTFSNTIQDLINNDIFGELGQRMNRTIQNLLGKF